MIRIEKISRVLVVATAVFLWSACAYNRSSVRTIPQDHLAEIQRPDIPLVVNDRVQDWLDYFQGSGRPHFERYLQRSGKYIPMMRKILRAHGLPEDLVYLSMIESGFNPHAYSRARATGAWQFIYQTGVRYGLAVNSWVDERRDPEKSTVAAAQYLKTLYDRFNNWYLAAAGYNAGEGKINRAIRKYATEDFWQLSRKRYLRAETRDYVPKLIAAALIAKNPSQYGFHVRYEEPVPYEEIILDSPIDLRIAAKLTDGTYEDLKALNPEILHWVTPPQSGSYSLRIPAGSESRFRSRLAKLDRGARMGEEKLKIDSATTFARLARERNIQEDLLAVANGRSLEDVVRPGDTVVLPMDPPEGEEFYEKVYERSRRGGSGGKVAVYRVRNGDTLNRISRRTGVRASTLRRLNPKVAWSRLKKGQSLALHLKAMTPAAKRVAKVSSPSSSGGFATHHVKSGDTLGGIAKKYRVSTRELKAVNGIASPRRLQAGRTIKVPIRQNLATMAPSL